MTSILGNDTEIKMTWRSKPGLRRQMVRYMMKKKGHAGVRALADILNMTYNDLYDIGALDGWLRKRNTQRRNRRKRQKNKLKNYYFKID